MPEATEVVDATVTGTATEIAMVAEIGIVEVETTEVPSAEMMIGVVLRAITGEILAL